MKKYYIGFAGLMALVIVCFGYAVSQGSAAKADQATNRVVEQMISKFELYTYSNPVPATLEQGGITDVPSTVHYTKLSDTKYKICFDYKSNASGFDAGWTGIFFGGLSGGQPADSQTYDNSNYFNPGVESNHKKGSNCQTVTSALYYNGTDSGYGLLQGGTGQGGDASSFCSDIPSDAKVSGSVKVSSVDTAKKIIYFSPSGQSVFDENTGAELPAIPSKNYNANTLFCDINSYKRSDAGAVKAGDSLIIYMRSASDSFLEAVDIGG